ncbi:MAG: short-chain dehydrogenase [Candidatus Dactylopiibacterium carminicum]|uniref:Short-chain dehydrogenase n=1 Tax=Candidatus Dactylopiibacterium carminicum TaxID=857335 RepID=A0A272EPT8_9RHOO|nr:SDR family oxidoreductase [Candidatus Dactylopiibacterium carminicum]KAF7598336.1 short-chain dehydrogenase [Candidatus Dactylopiibacterium carminicum]PAS92046.1 MAG: short-chain dehydrogenase [Candidatus Dactylopiibacterium carminicum]PAS95473.1 MAG: short-chain dehydrogenase [Candidatus Dactylopiibacterium carminicum]PAS97388.1 MAG: short-chain dehydrogenase [Candidatus Dactylopiibacterium carminicum]
MNRKIALITGGSRGLGRNAALKLAARGVDLIITWRSQADEAQTVVREAGELGARAVALPLDVADSASFAAFANAVSGALRTHWQRERFDYLLNNAGVGLHMAFTETTEAQFDEMMRIHLKAPFFLSQALLPLIEDGGRILNVSSGLARFSYPGSAAYATMKGGLEVLTRYMALELAPRRIAVNVIAPGAIATDFSGGRVRDNAELNATIAGRTALGRVGLPDDIGDAMSLLLSDEAGWINGQRIEVAGGIHL